MTTKAAARNKKCGLTPRLSEALEQYKSFISELEQAVEDLERLKATNATPEAIEAKEQAVNAIRGKVSKARKIIAVLMFNL